VLLCLPVLAIAVPGGTPQAADAASHREAPLIAMDPPADITDFFLFRSYEPGKQEKVLLVMDVIPGEEPSAGPNYYHFDPNVLYSINVDNNGDGVADDVRFDFHFRTEPIRGDIDQLDLFLSYVGAAGSPLPPVTALDGAGSEGLGLRQRYSVTMTKGKKSQALADNLIVVPSNVGPRTMPNYDALAAQGMYDLGGGVRAFAGQRDDPFFIDLGATFDTLNLRNPGVDMLSGFNVHTIALEVPASLLTQDGKDAGTTASPKIGAYASTSRRKVTVLRQPGHDEETSGPWVQIQRLANPLVNETIIPTEDKDLWNTLEPQDESRFLEYYLKPRLALALQTVLGINTGCTPFGTPACSPNPPAAAANLALSNFNRTDLVNILLKYSPADTQLSELLRLDLRTKPLPLAQQNRLTVLGGDNTGWPNGRRPIDDVTDIAVQVVGGPNYIAANAGDGVNANDKALPAAFPFIATPWDGRNRVHKNP
jgi:hypothetical protein